MKKALTIIALSLLACSCGPQCVREGRSIYKAYFNYVLKDPKSLEIYSEKYTLTEKANYVAWEIDYSVKNSLGGRVRKTLRCTTFRGLHIQIDGEKWESYFIEDLR